MSLQPTREQIPIINDNSNSVVIATPGSGKTFTLSCKIKGILPTLLEHKGVIAISFTNKASDELKARCLGGGAEPKSSFFGTIDKFYLVEIIMPFGRHLFGDPQTELQVVELDEVVGYKQIRLEVANRTITDEQITPLQKLYCEGKIILESFGLLAYYILQNSLACQRYLKARYSDIIIDEYQDCGYWQHIMFTELVNMGLRGVAVGDINQSIFAFAGKDSKYLIALTQDSSNFTTYPLTRNHRCHSSIINYSTRLLSERSNLVETDCFGVYQKSIDGSEIEIAHWLTATIPQIMEQFGVNEMKEVGVLVKNNWTGDVIHENILLPHRQIIPTPLDSDISLWGGFFRNMLTWFFNSQHTKHELVEGYLNLDFQRSLYRKFMTMLKDVENDFDINDFRSSEEINKDFFEKLIEAACLVLPNARNKNAENRLKGVLSNKQFLECFMPPLKNEIQIMTLYKSKGLEFDIVFHLNLYEYILPQKYNGRYGNLIQDLNLHYVGITRAKTCCILCTSTQRHSRGRLISANPSEFLSRHDLDSLREDCPF